MPESFFSLKEFFESHKSSENKKNLVFFDLDSETGILSYRKIQNAYDRAFKKAGLSYRSTHVLRHGGCRHLYNQVPDTAMAQQLLGNSDLKSTLVYAKRASHALNEAALTQWDLLKKR